MYSKYREGVSTMVIRKEFATRHSEGSADNSICLHCFLTVSAVQGGANLREMERRHKCDPMTTVDCPKTRERVVPIREGFEDFLFEDSWFEDYQSALNTTDAEQEKILRRLRKYGRKMELSIIRRAGNTALG
jgi:hypothetical protein